MKGIHIGIDELILR